MSHTCFRWRGVELVEVTNQAITFDSLLYSVGFRDQRIYGDLTKCPARNLQLFKVLKQGLEEELPHLTSYNPILRGVKIALKILQDCDIDEDGEIPSMIKLIKSYITKLKSPRVISFLDLRATPLVEDAAFASPVSKEMKFHLVYNHTFKDDRGGWCRRSVKRPFKKGLDYIYGFDLFIIM